MSENKRGGVPPVLGTEQKTNQPAASLGVEEVALPEEASFVNDSVDAAVDSINTGLLERLGKLADLADANPGFTRRACLGLGAAVGLELLAAWGALKPRQPSEGSALRRLTLGRASPPPIVGSGAKTSPKAEASPVPSETTSTQPPQPPEEAPQEPAAAAAEKTSEQILTEQILRVPRLRDLAAQGKISMRDAERIIAHIESLKAVEVTPEDFHRLQVDDTTHANLFAAHPFFGNNITIRRIVVHWSGKKYPSIQAMGEDMMSLPPPGKPLNRKNCHGILDGRVLVRTTPQGRYFKGAHAPGANHDSYGLEFKDIGRTEDVDELNLKYFVATVVKIARETNLPISILTLWTHYSVDLIENEQNYDKDTGIVLRDDIRKMDFPHDFLLDVLLPKAIALDKALGPR